MIYESVLDTIGHTPVVHLEKISGNDIYVKLEMFNPGQSIKDRIAYEMIDTLVKEGKLGKEGQKAVEGTSGNTGIGLALVCANKGIPLTIVMRIRNHHDFHKLKFVKNKLNAKSGSARPVRMLFSH